MNHVKKKKKAYLLFYHVQQTRVLEPDNSLHLSAVWFLSKLFNVTVSIFSFVKSRKTPTRFL